MRLLDLFCGAGGAARGYQQAGFHVTGVDLAPQPRYAGDEFIQADALTLDLTGFDAIHASPPCQGYSRMRHLPWLKGREYPLLIEPVRERLQASGVPWVIENVEDSPLAREPGLFGVHGIWLCGTMFDLGIYRHRPFESSVVLPQPPHRRHREVLCGGSMLAHRERVSLPRLGIDWMTQAELSQAIPPAYTEFIGKALISHLTPQHRPATGRGFPCSKLSHSSSS